VGRNARYAWDVELLDEFPSVVRQEGGEGAIDRLPNDRVKELARLTSEQISTAAIKTGGNRQNGLRTG
jgi:hypothetical protein